MSSRSSKKLLSIFLKLHYDRTLFNHNQSSNNNNSRILLYFRHHRNYSWILQRITERLVRMANKGEIESNSMKKTNLFFMLQMLQTSTLLRVLTIIISLLHLLLTLRSQEEHHLSTKAHSLLERIKEIQYFNHHKFFRVSARIMDKVISLRDKSQALNRNKQ